MLLLDCEPLLENLVPRISLDFLFDVLESETEAMIIDMSLIMKLMKMEIIKEEMLNDPNKLSKVCKLLDVSDFRIKAKAVRLLVKILPVATKESSQLIYQMIRDDIIDLANNEGNESFYTFILIDGLAAKLDGLPERSEFLEFLCDNDFYDIICNAIDNCTVAEKCAVLEQIKDNLGDDVQSDGD